LLGNLKGKREKEREKERKEERERERGGKERVSFLKLRRPGTLSKGV